MVVLVIEDSSSMRQLICHALQRVAGVVAIEASDGVDGLAKLAEIRPDVIMTDLNMPALDGFGFLERLRKLPEHEHTPVIILTTEAAREDRERALALGVSTYVTKPVRQNDVVAALSKVAGSPKSPRAKTQSSAPVLRVDYNDASDLLDDYTDQLSAGTIDVAYERVLPADAPVQLALAFPGMAEPIYLDGVVRSSRAGDEPTLTIALLDGPQLVNLAQVIERIRVAVGR